MTYASFYILSWLLHLFALYYGLKAWHIGDKLFCESSFLQFFHCDIERKFWTVCIGSISNAVFIFIIPFYIIELNGSATGWMEPWFNVFHIASALVTAIWHHSTYNDLKDLIR